MFVFGDPGGRMYTVAGTTGANILAHWTSSNRIASWSVSAGNGRTTGSCLRTPNAGGSGGVILQKVFPAQQTVGTAFAFRASAIPTSTMLIAAFIDVTTTQVDLRLNSDGSLALTRNGTTLATTAAGLVIANTYGHIEMKIKVATGTSGTYDLWFNGVNKLTSAGTNTQASGNATASTFQIGPATTSGTSSNYDYDDIIVYDSQATDANGFTDITGPIGDCGLVWLLPTGAGTTTQWTPDSGSNYARVNETTPDGDTSYVDDGTIGHVDTYAMADLVGTGPTVKSVASIHYARKTDASARGMRAELRSAGGNTAHATEIALGNSYAYYWSTWGQDPNNGTPTNWTASAVNALEAGQKVSS